MPYPDFSTQEHRTIESRNPVAFVNLKYGANLISWPRISSNSTLHATSFINNRTEMAMNSNNNPLDMSLEDNVENNLYPGYADPYANYLGFDGQYHNYKGFIGKERNKYGKGMICEIWSDYITPNNHLSHPDDGWTQTTTMSTMFINSQGEYWPGDDGVWRDKTNEGDWNNFNIYTQGMYLFSDVSNPGSDGDTYFMDGKNLSGGSKSHGYHYGNLYFTPLDNFEVIDTSNGFPYLTHWDEYGYYYWKNKDDFNWGKVEGLENQPDQIPFGAGYYNRGFWVWCDNPAGDKYPIYSGMTGYNEARKYSSLYGSPSYFNTETEEYINGIGGFEKNFNPYAKVTVVSGFNGNEIAYPMDYILDHVDEALHSTSSIIDIKDNTVSCFNHNFPGMTGYKMIGSMKNFEISKAYNFRVNKNTTMRIFEPKNLQESWLDGKDPEKVCENLGISYFPPRVTKTLSTPNGDFTAITGDYTSDTANAFQMAKPNGSVPPVLDFTDKSSTIAWNFDYSDTSLLGHTESTESFKFIVKKQTPGDIEQRSSVYDYDPDGFLFCKKNGATVTPLYYVGVDVYSHSGYPYPCYSGGVTINVVMPGNIDYGYRSGTQGGGLAFIDNSFWTQNSSYIGESMGELFPYLSYVPNHSSGQHIHKAGNGGYSSGDGIVIYWYNRSNGMWYDVNLRLKSNNTKVTIPSYDSANMGGRHLAEYDVTGDGSKVCYWSFDLVEKT